MSMRKMTKEELRMYMSAAKKKHSAIKKIESPLARYNELDQLVCIICKMVVRNEAIWPVHLNSKIHKENIELAKKTRLESIARPQAVSPMKRSPADAVFQEPAPPKRVKSILKNTQQSPSNIKAVLPADFFESPVQSNITNSEPQVDEAKEIKESAQSSVLPEGFFDDPKKDAKARNVEYKDPIEEEWEKFQKEIKEETAQSEQIIGDDQEEAANERQLDVIEEQLRNWSRVIDLIRQKEQVQTAEKKQEQNDSSSDEEDFDEFFDWRAKKSYRD